MATNTLKINGSIEAQNLKSDLSSEGGLIIKSDQVYTTTSLSKDLTSNPISSAVALNNTSVTVQDGTSNTQIFSGGFYINNSNIFNILYPIGSIYITTSPSIDPTDIFKSLGVTTQWQRIVGKFLFGGYNDDYNISTSSIYKLIWQGGDTQQDKGGSKYMSWYNSSNNNYSTTVMGTINPDNIFRVNDLIFKYSGANSLSASNIIQANIEFIEGVKQLTYKYKEDFTKELNNTIHLVGVIKNINKLCSADKGIVNNKRGEYSHELTTNEMPNHTHTYSKVSTATGKGYKDATYDNDGTLTWNNQATTGERGNNYPHNNMPPYEITYMWKRIS